MKKLFYRLTIIVICLTLPLVLYSCKKKVDYLSYVSELRKDVFIGEKDNFNVVVYSGFKEEPTLLEGKKEQTALTLTFKVNQKEECSNPLTIKFSLGDKNYQKELAFNPVKSTLCAEVEVNSLPEKSIEVQIIEGENCTTINAISKLNENSISYSKALEKATQKASEFLSKHTTKNTFKGEIIVRLLCENERNYYYVCFVCENGEKLAYLLNAKTGEIIAQKIN